MTDVIVVGGGPAGATAAAILREHGLSVVVLEKETFPRFQIGESLLPFNNRLFQRIGVWDELVNATAAGTYHPKRGAYFVTGDGAVDLTFRFDRTFGGDLVRAFQVERAKFDQLLLRNAAACGADVREATQVTEVDTSDPERVRVRVKSRDGAPETIEARFVVDASGHGALLATRNGTRADAPELRKIAIFAHYRNVTPSAADDNSGNTVVVVLKNSWFWMIPISREIMSVGIVVDRDEFRTCGLAPADVLSQTIEATPYVRARMTQAERASTVYVRQDYSFRVKGITGRNYAMVGDAAGFIDPIFSTGVFMAMKSAEIASDAIASRLRTGSMTPLARYARQQKKAYNRYFRFIEYFYTREFLEIFLRPSPRFGLYHVIVSMLAGDGFERNFRRWKMELFFLLVKIQKRRAIIAKPIDWDQLPSIAHAPLPEERSLA
jgi:flavin-dependent dehydrogenase